MGIAGSQSGGVALSDVDFPEPSASAGGLQDLLEPIWAETLGDPRVVVALIDGPVDVTHEALRNADITQLGGAQTQDGAASRHGTHVASVIFGQHEGPVHGLAPRCRGLVIPVFTDDAGTHEPTVSQADLAVAVRTATAHRAHVINISAGELSSDGIVDPALKEAIRAATDSGILLVAAAGDQGCLRPQVPSSLDDVLAVGVVGAADAGAYRDDSVCLLAPGDAILGAVPRDGVVAASGSSYAAAITSGLAALLLSLQAKDGPLPDPSLVREALVASGPVLDPRGAVRELRRQLVQAPSAGPPHNARTQRLLSALDGVEYVVAPGSLDRKFRGVRAEDFGTVTVHVPQTSSYRVEDFHYRVGRDRLGMRLIPVSDERDVVLPDGTPVGGADVLDAVLRHELRLGDDEPIFAILSYIHPEEHASSPAMLPRSSKLQLAYRHVGSYLGAGRTTHALSQHHRWRGESLLRMGLNADRHPANVQVLSLRGVPQAVLNRNARIVDGIVTAGVRVPEDADNITDCPTVDLTTILQYYRDVIRQADYLEDLAWYTNCSVHKMIVVNVLLNVPHNVAAFKEIFGEDGPALWADFRHRYATVHGEPFTTADETTFTPLWKLVGLASAAIRPLTLREYLAYRAAYQEDRLEQYDGRQPLRPNAGLAWPLENVVDLLREFIDTYASFERAGGIMMAAELLLMAEPLARRIGLEPRAYIAAVTPIAGKILAAEAVRRGTAAMAWLETAHRELRWTVRTSTPDVGLDAAVEAFVVAARHEFFELLRHGPPRPDGAAAWLADALPPALDDLRRSTTDLGTRTGRFASPSVFHRIALGRYPKSPLVEMRTVCTVMDQADLVVGTSPQRMRWST